MRPLRVRPPLRLLRRLLVVVALAGPVMASTPSSVSGQELTRADSAAVLLDAAREFEAEGREDVAEALYRLLAERYGATPAGAQAAARLAAAPMGAAGRVELQVWGTLYGLWLGVAIPTALGADGTEAYGAGILLGAPGGLLAARALTRSRDLSEGQTRAITWGGTWGTWQGLGWAEVLDLGEDVFCDPGGFCYPTGDETEERFTSMIVGGLAGLTGGALLARRPIEAGVASGAHYGSLWGTWLGVAGSVLGDLEDDDLWAATLLTGNAGLVAGALVADRYDLGRNRVRLISLGGLLGGLGGAGLDLLLQPDDEKVAIAVPLALSVAGIGVATHLTRDRHEGSTGPDAFDGPTSLLRLDEGRLTLDLPAPTPTLLWSTDAWGRDRWTPGLSFSLVRASF